MDHLHESYISFQSDPEKFYQLIKRLKLTTFLIVSIQVFLLPLLGVLITLNYYFSLPLYLLASFVLDQIFLDESLNLCSIGATSNLAIYFYQLPSIHISILISDTLISKLLNTRPVEYGRSIAWFRGIC